MPFLILHYKTAHVNTRKPFIDIMNARSRSAFPNAEHIHIGYRETLEALPQDFTAFGAVKYRTAKKQRSPCNLASEML